MNDRITPEAPLPIDDQHKTDVSKSALSVARRIDRLAPGTYTITIRKPESTAERWQIEIAQPVTIHKGEIGNGGQNKPQVVDL